jgi:hypothetical protein
VRSYEILDVSFRGDGSSSAAYVGFYSPQLSPNGQIQRRV